MISSSISSVKTRFSFVNFIHLVGASAGQHVVQQHLPRPALGSLRVLLALDQQGIAQLLPRPLREDLEAKAFRS